CSGTALAPRTQSPLLTPSPPRRMHESACSGCPEPDGSCGLQHKPPGPNVAQIPQNRAWSVAGSPPPRGVRLEAPPTQRDFVCRPADIRNLLWRPAPELPAAADGFAPITACSFHPGKPP